MSRFSKLSLMMMLFSVLNFLCSNFYLSVCREESVPFKLLSLIFEIAANDRGY